MKDYEMIDSKCKKEETDNRIRVCLRCGAIEPVLSKAVLPSAENRCLDVLCSINIFCGSWAADILFSSKVCIKLRHGS